MEVTTMQETKSVTSEDIEKITDADVLENDARSKMLYKMLHLYTLLKKREQDYNLSFLGYNVSYSAGILNIAGAADKLQVNGDTFLDVEIGPNFKTFDDFPHDLHQYIVDVFLRN